MNDPYAPFSDSLHFLIEYCKARVARGDTDAADALNMWDKYRPGPLVPAPKINWDESRRQYVW